MSPSLEGFVLSSYPPGTKIYQVHSYRPEYLPYPARVTLAAADGRIEHCVIKTWDDGERAVREASVLAAMKEVGLSVPAILAVPTPLEPESLFAALLSELPGEPLPWLGLTDLNDADLTCRLLATAVDAMSGLSKAVADHAVGAVLPRHTLVSEFDEVVDRGKLLASLPLYHNSVGLLQSVLPRIQTPLAFSNGDYNPLNFLHVAGEVTGWLDFENTCFEDPYIGFAKFVLWSNDDYGWGTGAKAGLVERYLYAHEVSPVEFLPRLMLRALRHLQEAALAEPPNPPADQQHTLAVLGDALDRLSRLVR